MIIKDVSLEDLNIIIEIEKNNFKDPWNYKTLYYETQLNKNSHFYGAYENDELIGYIGLWLMIDYIDITTLAVSKAYQNKGIATQLIHKAEVLAKHLLVDNISLEVNVNNKSAINLYYKCGFVEIRRIKNYYSKLKEDAYLMQKEIKDGK